MKTIKTVSIHIIGWFFILVGIAGLFLPFLQGILFILLGLYILSLRSVFAQRQLKKIATAYPKTYQAHMTAKRSIESFFGLRQPITVAAKEERL